jgi:hypothetical protein
MRFAAYPGVGLRITLSLKKTVGLKSWDPSGTRKRNLGEMDGESEVDQSKNNVCFMYKFTRR